MRTAPLRSSHASRQNAALTLQVRALTREAADLRDLVYRLSDSLTDEGPSWSNDGLHHMRQRVADALPGDDCPEWLHPFRTPAPAP